MCDYSLESVKSRDAVNGEDLVLKRFGFGPSKGFASESAPDCAVCCKSGVEMTLHFAGVLQTRDMSSKLTEAEALTGETPVTFFTLTPEFGTGYKDGLITPSGRFVILQHIPEGTRVTITKALPAELLEAAKGEIAFKEEILVADLAPAPSALVD